MPYVTKLLQQLVKFISIKSAQLNLNKRNSYIFCNFFGVQWADRKQVFSLFLHVLWQISNVNLKSPCIYLELCTILILFDFLFTYSTCNVEKEVKFLQIKTTFSPEQLVVNFFHMYFSVCAPIKAVIIRDHFKKLAHIIYL